MSDFSAHAVRLTDSFYRLVQPNNPLVQRVARQLVASHMRDLRSTLEGLVGFVTAMWRYDTDQNVWGTTDYWAPPDELMYSDRGDCDDFCLFASSVLFALGIPHEVVIGEYAGGIGHVWVEVADEGEGAVYLLEFTSPVLYVLPYHVDYTRLPYKPYERVVVR